MASDPGQKPKKGIGKPDTLTRTGIIFALICVVLSMMLDGGNPAVLFKLPALVLVFGGTIAASIAGVVKADAKNVRSTVKKAFKSTVRDPDEDIQRMVGLAEVARREGLLALERAAEGVEDPFFKKGIELTVDGTDPEEIRDIMEGEIESQRERHQAGIKFFTDMGGFSPTLGILGTVIGLVHVLANINSPGTLGPAIASAFTATLWGVLMANLVWLPISNKLRRVSELEINSRRLVLDGILAIQAGSSPRMIEARLLSYLPQKERAAVQRKKAAA
jgi:chemotaxis protein MotA